MTARHLAFFHFDVPLDPGGPHGGAETALVATARALVRRGHRVTVLGRLTRDASADGVRYLCAGGAGEWDIEAGLARLTDGCDLLVSTLRADVLEAARAHAHIGRRVLWPHVGAVAPLQVPVMRLAEIADRLVTVSRDQAEMFTAAGVPPLLITVMPNGVDGEVFHAAGGTRRTPARVVFAGALVPDKGLDVLLHAMPLVRALVPAAELVVCGSAALWARTPFFDPEAVRRELPWVHFRGALDRTTLADELRGAALAVVPTPPARWREAFGMASVEAQACGTPVVVVRNGGLPETVRDGETGWVVDQATPELLAAAIVAALRDPVRLEAMGRAAARWARARFSWRHNARAWEALAAAPVRARAARSGRRPGRPEVALVTTWQQPCGLARYAEGLVAALPPGTVRVLAERVPGPLESATPPVPVERVWRRGEALEPLVDAVARSGVGLVHVNHHGALFGSRMSAALAALAVRGVRSVVTMHAPNQLDPEIAAMGRVAEMILVHSEGARLEVIANGVPPDVVRVMPHGVRPVATHDAATTRDAMGLRPGERLVVSVGFLQAHKGVHEVIRALAALRSRLPLQYLVLGGCVPGDPASTAYRDFCLAEAERLGVRDLVTLVDGYVSDPALTAYLRAADVIVLPYQTAWWEASGAARDALASGRPVITSAALAFADLGAAVFRTTGAFHLAQAIEAVLTTPALAAELVAAGRRVAESQAWPRIAAAHAALYDELRARPRPAKRPEMGAARVPRVHVMLREHASRTGGGDAVLAQALAGGMDPARCAVVCREGGRVTADADLAHLFNFSTYTATREHARRACELGVPYVVTALYEDWPSFKVAAEALTQRYRTRLGLPPSVDLEAYARLHAGEQRDLLTHGRPVAAGARCVVATGASEAARLARDFPGVRVRVVPLAVPGRGAAGPRLADAFRTRYGTRDFVLCVGRLEPRKNQLALLEALADQPVDVVLATGGVAYRTDYLEACRSVRRRGRTLYLPRLDDDELRGAYEAARVHVLPSWFELPGLATLEALGAGCAVVATDRGTLRDHLADTIPYAPPDDPAALARAVEAAGYWDFGPAQRLAATFTRARHVAAWWEVYAEALGAVAEQAEGPPVGAGDAAAGKEEAWLGTGGW